MKGARLATAAVLALGAFAAGAGAAIAAEARDLARVDAPRIPRAQRERRAAAPTYRDLLRPRHDRPIVPKRPPLCLCKRGPWRAQR
ncbi:MAG: hypothetical protein AB7O45_16075 [Alphaproteobacteria bacterium]